MTKNEKDILDIDIKGRDISRWTTTQSQKHWMLICTSSSIARTNSPRMGSLSSKSYCQRRWWWWWWCLWIWCHDDYDYDLPFQVEIGAGWPKMFAVTDADRYDRLRGMNWFLFCPRFDFILTLQVRINFLYFSPVKIDLLLHEQCFSGTGTILVDHDFLFTVRFPLVRFPNCIEYYQSRFWGPWLVFPQNHIFIFFDSLVRLWCREEEKLLSYKFIHSPIWSYFPCSI